MPPQKIIIDTDPGVDDIFALLLALNAPTPDLQVLLISLVYGNIDVESTLRNTTALFHVLDLERLFRLRSGADSGFPSLDLPTHHPIIALGADSPLRHPHEYDFFHGKDGVQGVHETHQHLSPTETWKHLFTASRSDEPPPPGETSKVVHLPHTFKPSAREACEEILDVLRTEEAGTVTIIALGPLTNISLAASRDPVAFARVKEVVIMGGALGIEGNVTPVAEFNVYSDSAAAAHILALTSQTPKATIPAGIEPPPAGTPTLNATLISLDLTHQHLVSWAEFSRATDSPLHEWVKAMMEKTFAKMKSEYKGDRPEEVEVALHDSLCVFYVLDRARGTWECREGVDVRVETEGQWTRGMTVVDRRGRRKELDPAAVAVNDHGGWCVEGTGNAVRVVTKSGVEEKFGWLLMQDIFGLAKSEEGAESAAVVE